MVINATVFVAVSVNFGVWSFAWWLIVVPFSFAGVYGGRLFDRGLREARSKGRP